MERAEVAAAAVNNYLQSICRPVKLLITRWDQQLRVCLCNNTLTPGRSCLCLMLVPQLGQVRVCAIKGRSATWISGTLVLLVKQLMVYFHIGVDTYVTHVLCHWCLAEWKYGNRIGESSRRGLRQCFRYFQWFELCQSFTSSYPTHHGTGGRILHFSVFIFLIFQIYVVLLSEIWISQ